MLNDIRDWPGVVQYGNPGLKSDPRSAHLSIVYSMPCTVLTTVYSARFTQQDRTATRPRLSLTYRTLHHKVQSDGHTAASWRSESTLEHVVMVLSPCRLTRALHRADIEAEYVTGHSCQSHDTRKTRVESVWIMNEPDWTSTDSSYQKRHTPILPFGVPQCNSNILLIWACQGDVKKSSSTRLYSSAASMCGACFKLGSAKQ